MKDLFGFNYAEEGEISLCQLDGKLNCMQYEFANLSSFTKAVSEVIIFKYCCLIYKCIIVGTTSKNSNN